MRGLANTMTLRGNRSVHIWSDHYISLYILYIYIYIIYSRLHLLESAMQIVSRTCDKLFVCPVIAIVVHLVTGGMAGQPALTHPLAVKSWNLSPPFGPYALLQ